jgi:hypothetical protein
MTTKDSAGATIITATELVARTYRGETVEIKGGTVARRDDGFYTVNGEGKHSLEGLKIWLGAYHYEFGETVFFPMGTVPPGKVK